LADKVDGICGGALSAEALDHVARWFQKAISDEREACAKVAEDEQLPGPPTATERAAIDQVDPVDLATVSCPVHAAEHCAGHSIAR